MTDFEKLENALKDMGFKDGLDYHTEQNLTDDYGSKLLAIYQGIGYAGFECIFYFDADGKFTQHGCWE